MEHKIPCIRVTKSGINVRHTVERLMGLKINKGCINGLAISDNVDVLLQERDLDQQLHDLLMNLHKIDTSYFLPSIISVLLQNLKNDLYFDSLR